MSSKQLLGWLCSDLRAGPIRGMPVYVTRGAAELLSAVDACSEATARDVAENEEGSP